MADTRTSDKVAIGVVDPDEVVCGVLTEHVRELDDSVVGYANLAAFTETIEASRPMCRGLRALGAR